MKPSEMSLFSRADCGSIVSRRTVVGMIAAPITARAAPEISTSGGEIVALYIEALRRDRYCMEENLARGVEVMTEAQIRWVDEPLHAAIGIEPASIADFAALVLFGFGEGASEPAASIVLDQARRMIT